MQTPPLQGISHIALSVDDLPAAMRFWVDVMGFEVTTDTPTLGFVVHRPSRIAIAVTDHGDAMRFDERHCGLDHLAFAVAGVDVLQSWQQRLQDHGIAHSPITDSGAGHHLNLRAPGDIPIELYVIDDATVAAFGLAGPDEAYAGSREPSSLAPLGSARSRCVRVRRHDARARRLGRGTRRGGAVGARLLEHAVVRRRGRGAGGGGECEGPAELL